MSGQVIAGIVGGLLPIVFTFLPGLREKYEALETNVKGGIMFGLLLLVGFGGFIPVCLGWFLDQIPLQCTQAGFEAATVNFIYAVGAYASTYLTIALPVTKTRKQKELNRNFYTE